MSSLQVSDNSLDQQGGAEGDTYTEYQYHKHCWLQEQWWV